MAFSVELALTADDRASGLMNRQSMPADHGMLFRFDQTRQVLMWMKNTPLPLDMIFIDADKGSYDAYYESCLRLVRSGGVVAIDNVLWGGSVADDAKQDDSTRAIRAINEKVHADARVDAAMLPIGDGLTLAVKR